ncbi:MAG: ABC transporter permease [Halanaerobiaceae bacterium]
MLYLFRIAVRNLSRNKFRTAVSILAIAVAVMIVVMARGLILGFLESTYSLYVDNVSGHVQIVAEEYRPRSQLMTLEYPVDGFAGEGLNPMLNELREIEDVNEVLPRLKFGAMASPGDKVVRMIGTGVDPEAEERHGALPEDIQKGRMPESGREILVSAGLLEELEMGLGDRVTLVFNDFYQSLRGVTFKIVGVRETGITTFDDKMFYLPLSTAQNVLHMDDMATEVLLMGDSTRQAYSLEERVQSVIEESGGGEYYSALAWSRTDPMMQTLQVSEKIYDIIYVFFLLLGSFVVINTMIMIIKDRTREIGMMGALGLEGRSILAIFAMEGTVMGFLGSLLGIIPGGLITYYLSQTGLDYYSRLMEQMEGMIFAPVIYPVFSLENLIYSFLLGVIITGLACLWPARRAARMEPVDALRYNQ